MLLFVKHSSLFFNPFLGHLKPHFDDRNRVYELDSCGGNGKVCLVYKDLKAGKYSFYS